MSELKVKKIRSVLYNPTWKETLGICSIAFSICIIVFFKYLSICSGIETNNYEFAGILFSAIIFWPAIVSFNNKRFKDLLIYLKDIISDRN